MLGVGLFHHVCYEHLLRNQPLFYRFSKDDVLCALDASISTHSFSELNPRTKTLLSSSRADNTKGQGTGAGAGYPRSLPGSFTHGYSSGSSVSEGDTHHAVAVGSQSGKGSRLSSKTAAKQALPLSAKPHRAVMQVRGPMALYTE